MSEKFQSLCRVALWIYGPLLALDDIPEFVEPKNKTVDGWLVGDLKKWLHIRGLNESGLKEQLKERVKTYMAMPLEEQPQVLPKEFGSADGVLNLIRTMVVMMTTMLLRSVERIMILKNMKLLKLDSR